MAAFLQVYDSRHLQADCQKPASALEPYTRQLSMGYLYLFLLIHTTVDTVVLYVFLWQGVVSFWNWAGRLNSSQRCSSVIVWLNVNGIGHMTKLLCDQLVKTVVCYYLQVASAVQLSVAWELSSDW